MENKENKGCIYLSHLTRFHVYSFVSLLVIVALVFFLVIIPAIIAESLSPPADVYYILKQYHGRDTIYSANCTLTKPGSDYYVLTSCYIRPRGFLWDFTWDRKADTLIVAASEYKVIKR